MKSLLKFAAALLFLLPILTSGCLPCPCDAQIANELPAGYMRLRVLDGATDKPIEGACAVVPEAGIEAYTDTRGFTPVMELPCIKDEGLNALLPYNEGRVTLIVYAEGYVPYLLLYCRVLPGTERETPTVYMWRDDGSLPVFEVIEAPPLSWAAELAQKYKP